jgi:hypothetical protein
MNENNRFRLVNDKGLCKCCLLTTEHKAIDCNVKSSCGFKFEKNARCSAKHHIAIHFAAGNFRQHVGAGSNRRRKPNTQQNSARAFQRVKEIENKSDLRETLTPARPSELPVAVSFHASAPDEEKRTYNVLQLSQCNEIPRSVKVFKVKFFGPKGYVIALAVGDSGSEVTIMRNDLREALGISGEKSCLNLLYADKSLKSCAAMKCSMHIQGTHQGAEKHEMKACYGIDDLHLPKRSLDIEK